eukprot:3144290-Pleurochrysis_carterae.AAC.2
MGQLGECTSCLNAWSRTAALHQSDSPTLSTFPAGSSVPRSCRLTGQEHLLGEHAHVFTKACVQVFVRVVRVVMCLPACLLRVSVSTSGLGVRVCDPCVRASRASVSSLSPKPFPFGKRGISSFTLHALARTRRRLASIA